MRHNYEGNCDTIFLYFCMKRLGMQKKHVCILALKNANYASIVDSRAVFEKANELYKQRYDSAYFAIQIIAEELELTIERGLITIKADATVADTVACDLII